MALLARHLNTYLAAISLTVAKHDLTSDMFTIAVKAWTALVTLLHGVYDQRHHASTLQAHKQVFQAVCRKVEKHAKEGAKAEERVQVGIALRGIIVSARLFPSSFKNILAGKQSLKKDTVTQTFEQLVKLYAPHASHQIVDYSMQILCLLWKSREKPRSAYREWV